MTDAVPSKDLIKQLRKERESWTGRDGITVEPGIQIATLCEAAADEIERLTAKLDTCGLQCSATMKSLVAENERLENHIINRPPLKVTCERCIGVIRELRDHGYHDWASRIERAAQPPASSRKVACETDDGLLKIHGEHESCDVCSPQPPGDGQQ